MTDSLDHDRKLVAPRPNRRLRLGLSAAAIPIACLLLVLNPIGSAALLGNTSAVPETMFALDDSGLPLDPADLVGGIAGGDAGGESAHDDLPVGDLPAGPDDLPIDDLPTDDLPIGDVPDDLDPTDPTGTAGVLQDMVGDIVYPVIDQAADELIAGFQALSDVWMEPVQSAEPVFSQAAPALRPACNAFSMALISYLAVVEGAYYPTVIPTRPIYLLTFHAGGPVLVACASSSGGSELDPVLVQLDEASDPAVEALAPVLDEVSEAISPVRGFAWDLPAVDEGLLYRCQELDVWKPALVSLPLPTGNRLGITNFSLLCDGPRTNEVNDGFAEAVHEAGTLAAPYLVDASDALSPVAAEAAPALRGPCSTAMVAIFVGTVVAAAVSPSYAGPVLGSPATVPVYILCGAVQQGDSTLDPVFDQLDEAIGEEVSDVAAALDPLGALIAPAQGAINEAAEPVEEEVLSQVPADVGVPANPCSAANLIGANHGERNMAPPLNRISLLGFVCQGSATPPQSTSPFG